MVIDMGHAVRPQDFPIRWPKQPRIADLHGVLKVLRHLAKESIKLNTGSSVEPVSLKLKQEWSSVRLELRFSIRRQGKVGSQVQDRQRVRKRVIVLRENRLPLSLRQFFAPCRA